jgi:hypothetical protein
MRHTLIILLLSTAAVAQDDYPVLVYPTPKATTPPALDGRLDDACWSAAPVCSGFTWYDRQELVQVQTSVRWLWDDQALYLGAWCDEPELELLHPLPVPRDAHQVFSTEAVEIFVDPRHDHHDYYQLAVNAAGSLYDSRGTEPSWESGAEAKAAVGDRGWGMELRIPWSAFKLTPKPGAVVGVNVCRDRTLKEREWSNWAQTKANFHDPDRFAHLVLDGTPDQIAGLTDEFRKGDRSGPLRIFSQGGIGTDTYVAMARQVLTRVEGHVAEVQQLRQQENAATAKVLGDKLAPLEQRLAGYRVQLDGDLDGAAFIKLEMQLTGVERELGELLWDARLEALLAAI